MRQPLAQPLTNPLWGVLRVFLWLTAGFAVVGLSSIAGLTMTPLGRATKSDAAVAWATGAITAGAMGMAMLISAGITALVARRAGRALAAIQKGDYLAHWTYEPAIWDGYVASQARMLRVAEWTIAGFILVVGTIIGITAASAPAAGQLKWITLTWSLGGSITLASGVVALFEALVKRRRAHVRACPEVIISRDAMYCGGDVLLFTGGGNGLYNARVLPPRTPGSPSQFEVVIGYSAGAGRAASAASIALLAAGRGAGVSNYQIVRRVPIPPGEEEIAGRICQTLLWGDPVVPS